MKRINLVLVSAAALALGLTATSASAQSNTKSTPPPATCYGNACTPTPTPTPPPSTCYGNACTPQQPRSSAFQVSGEALIGGFGNARFVGQEGYNVVEQEGAAEINLGVTGACADCSDITGSSFARQKVNVASGALGNQSGTDVSSITHGAAVGLLRFSFQSGPAPAQPAPTPPSGH